MLLLAFVHHTRYSGDSGVTQTPSLLIRSQSPTRSTLRPHPRGIVGPLPQSRGITHLTIVDRFTRWPEAIPLSNTSTTTCARALVANWVARFGVPAHISSDRGAQFTSGLWSSMAHLLGVTLHFTTAYHPQANGMVERFHRRLKTALRARLSRPDWMDELPWVLLGTAPKEDLETSSAELVYGDPLAVPGDSISAPRGRDEPRVSFLSRLREKVGSLARCVCVLLSVLLVSQIVLKHA